MQLDNATSRPIRFGVIALAAAATLGMTACSKSSSDMAAAASAPMTPVAVVAPPPEASAAAPSRTVVAQNDAPVARREAPRVDHRPPRAERPLPPRGDRDDDSAAGSTRDSQRVAAAACPNCGVVESFNVVQVQGQTNGVGAVAGGVGGALLGNRIAGGNNRTVGGVVGAIGGGLIGNEVEKHQRKSEVYDVHVRMEDGSIRTVRQATSPTVGARVLVEGDGLHARS